MPHSDNIYSEGMYSAQAQEFAGDGSNLPLLVEEAIDAYRDACLSPKTGWRARQEAKDALCDAIKVAIGERVLQCDDEFERGAKGAMDVCFEVHANGEICADPDVVAAMSESQAKACLVAIRKTLTGDD